MATVVKQSPVRAVRWTIIVLHMVYVASTRELTSTVARAIRGTREMDTTAARYHQLLLLLKQSARLRSFQVCLQINLITNEKDGT